LFSVPGAIPRPPIEALSADASRALLRSIPVSGVVCRVWLRVVRRNEALLNPTAGARRDRAGGEMPGTGHTLQNLRGWHSVVYMPKRWASMAGKSSRRRSGLGVAKSGQD